MTGGRSARFDVQLNGLQALSSEELDAINGWVDRLGPIVRLSASLCPSLPLSAPLCPSLPLCPSVSALRPNLKQPANTLVSIVLGRAGESGGLARGFATSRCSR